MCLVEKSSNFGVELGAQGPPRKSDEKMLHNGRVVTFSRFGDANWDPESLTGKVGWQWRSFLMGRGD